MPTTRSPEDTARLNRRLLAEAAAIIDGWPGVRDRLRADHVPDAKGRCRTCRTTLRAAPPWPCALAMISGATLAR